MKRSYKLLIIALLSFTLVLPNTYAQTKASSQFKSYDKRDSSRDESKTTDYKDHSNSLFNRLTQSSLNDLAGRGIESAQQSIQNSAQKQINNIRQYVSNNMPAQSSYRNFRNYQQAVRDMRSAEQTAIRNVEKQAANYTKTLNAGGKILGGINVANDAMHLNDESRHKHSSIRQLALTTRYMKVLYGGGALFNKGLEPAAQISSLANDAIESDEFIDWANEQDNPILDVLDDITDKVNDKAYKDACQLLEWLGINPPNSLPALRTAIKPNIYLYPEETTNISVVFDSPELLLTVIPDYNTGWYATVDPNSNMLVDGKYYGYLFYESMTGDYNMQKEYGFKVPVKGRKAFFEYIANYYGFNKQETEDFVTFWCSRLDSNKEYAMYPQLTESIDTYMAVKITPQPESIFRIWFLFYELEDSIELSKPKEIKAERKGYTMVEWGGIVADN